MEKRSVELFERGARSDSDGNGQERQWKTLNRREQRTFQRNIQIQLTIIIVLVILAVIMLAK